MRIGELSKRTGVSVRSIRHYDESGLLEAERGDNGYREFDESAVGRVLRIKRLIRDGLTIEEVLPMSACLSAPENEEQVCGHLLELYERKLRALDDELAALQRKRRDLIGRLARLRGRLHAADATHAAPTRRAARGSHMMT